MEGVEMPGAKAHNEILGQFHSSLSQDEVLCVCALLAPRCVPLQWWKDVLVPVLPRGRMHEHRCLTYACSQGIYPDAATTHPCVLLSRTLLLHTYRGIVYGTRYV